MTAIPKGSKVLVTGANGYIAMWVVRILLEHRYSVRATVRSAGKIAYVKDYFAKLGPGYGEDRLEFVVVDDIVKEGAFDETVKGVDAIAHTASPFHLHAKDPQELIRPAVQGTVGILKSALKNGKDVKRVVITSSTAAVNSSQQLPRKFSDLDWNTSSAKEVEENGKKSVPSDMYEASKTLAERAAWEFHDKVKSEVAWDLTTVNPTFVFGPPIHDISSIATLNTSLALWHSTLFPKTPKTKGELLQSSTWVDVRDVALAHVLALEKPDAAGHRFITCADSFIWQEWLDALNTLSANPLPSCTMAAGFPELTQGEKNYGVVFDTTKASTILGIKWISKADSAKDTLLAFANRGW